MCYELITARLPALPRESAGDLSKRSSHDRSMLPLRAQRIGKKEVGSNFILIGTTPGQGCSCGILHRGRTDYEILGEMKVALARTVEFLSREAGAAGFELSLVDLTPEGPAVAPRHRIETTSGHLAKVIARGHIPRNTLFIVKARPNSA
jgi:hypothetical protein